MKSINFIRIGRAATVAIFMMLISPEAFAETLIKGRIVNEKELPVPNATATLLCTETYTIIKGDMVDDEGWFYIEKVKPGTYILSLRSVGYETDDTRIIVVPEDTPAIDVRTVPILETVIFLTDVVVVVNRNA